MLTIGAFSKLCRVSARMLRHYDAIGLLRPRNTDAETGYRYYDAGQFTELSRIERLKSFGFTLAEVGQLVKLPPEELSRRIHQRRLQRYGELEKLRQSLRHMDEQITEMEGNIMAENIDTVTMMEIPEQKVFGVRRTITVSQIPGLFEELFAEMGKRGLRPSGPTQMLYHGEEFSYENMDVEAQAQVEGTHGDVQARPAQLCAVAAHIGPYDTLKYAYDALCAWLAEHGDYEVCGPAVEQYLKDQSMAANPEEYETAVMFPVKKKA